MPQIVVTQTAREYADYQKRKQRERLYDGCLAILVSLAACAMGYWIVASL